LLAFWLLALAPVVAIVYLIWAHRRRMAAQAAAREERLARILGTAPAGSTPGKPAAADAPETRAATAGMAGGMHDRYRVKPTVLSETQSRLLASLRAALPQHEVLPLLNLAALVEVPGSIQGREREQRQRILAQYTVDCVVCSRELRILAAVDMESADAADARFKAECLKLAGLPYIRLAVSQLAEAELRSLVLGDQNSLDERHL
jgi:hypothetical protein